MKKPVSRGLFVGSPLGRPSLRDAPHRVKNKVPLETALADFLAGRRVYKLRARGKLVRKPFNVFGYSERTSDLFA